MVSRGVITSYFMKTPLYCLTNTPFSNCSHPPSQHTGTSLSSQTSTPAVLSVVLFLWLNGWSHCIWCAILLNDDMDLHMWSLLGNLVPEGTWCVSYATRCKVDSGLTHNVVFYWYSRFDITQTHKLTSIHSTIRGY